MPEFNAHTLTPEATADHLKTDLVEGLTTEEVRQRLARSGPNELREEPPPTLLQRLWDQFNNFVVILLIVAAIISAIVGAYTGEGFTDALAIVAIIALNAILGGVNARDLRTFEVDMGAAARAVESIPADRVAVFMSGIRSSDDFATIARTRVDAVLVGEGLMRAADPGERLREIVEGA